MNRTKRRAGISLVEVTLALGVASVSFAAIFGLLPISIQANQTSAAEMMATDIVAAVAADLHTTTVTSTRDEPSISPKFAISVPGTPVSTTTSSALFFNSAGQFTTSVDSDSRYRLTIRFLPNGKTKGAVLAHLKVSWPAQATVANTPGSIDSLLGLDRS